MNTAKISLVAASTRATASAGCWSELAISPQWSLPFDHSPWWDAHLGRIERHGATASDFDIVRGLQQSTYDFWSV